MNGQEGQESKIELVELDRMTPLPVVAPMIAVRRHGRAYITVNALTCITVGLAAQALAKSAKSPCWDHAHASEGLNSP